MNEFKCRLCGTKKNKNEVSIGPFPKAAQFYPKKNEFDKDKPVMLEVTTCSSCNLVQLKNRPVDYYKTVITAATLSTGLQNQREIFFRDIYKKLNKQSPSAIEIGCANGANLPLLEKSGFKASGVEFQSGTLMEYKEDERIRDLFIDEIPSKENNFYDLVICFNFLEHQPDQYSYIHRLYDLVTIGGYCLITVPNFEFLQEENCSYEFVADHLVYYTLGSLVKAFSSFGFSVVESKLINYDNDILLIAQKKSLPNLAAMKKELDSLVIKFNLLLNRFSNENKNIAVWGAGHRGLALLSLVDYEKINCIIDSAPFKQSKYSPISHLKIISPDILKSSECNIGVLIVMLPGIYPDEVIKSVKKLGLKIVTIKFVHNDFIEV